MVDTERLRTLVEFSFDAYWETDAQHRFTRQDYSERLADAPASGTDIGKTRWEIPYLEPDEEAWRKHRAMLDAHLPFRDFELARPTADGGKRYMSVSGVPVFDGSGQFVGYRGVGRDITERKRAEDEHRQHLRFLQSMDRVNRAIQGTGNLEQMMNDVLGAVLEIFASDRAWLLYPCDPDAPSWRVVMERTSPQFPGAAARGRDLPMVPEAAEVARAALSSRASLPAGPGHERQVKPAVGEHFGVRSEILMALRPKSDQAYLFGLHQCAQPRSWTKEEQRLFEEIGHRLADALSSLIAFRSLRESERRLEEAQRVAHLGYWDRDLVANRVVLSEESWRIFGIGPHERPADLAEWNKRWQAFIHPEDRTRVLAAVQASLAEGPRYDVEFRIIRKDGDIRVIHSQGDVIHDDSGRAVRMFGTQQDITALRESEQRLQAAQRLARVGWWERDYTTQRAALSEEACRIFGVQPVDLPHWQERWVNLIHPDDRQKTAEASEIALRGGPRYDVEYRVLRPDGTVRVVHSQGDVTRDDDGRAIRQFGAMQDITELRRAEQELRASEARFRTFVDHARDAFLLLDGNLTIVDVNRQACESLGWTREELIGMHPRDFDAALDEASIARRVKRAEAGETITFETLHRRRDESVFPVEIRTGTFEQGGELFYLALARDISERKLAEEKMRGKDDALQSARAELARVSRVTTLGELTASIAHEVNQPLGAMVANAAACTRWLAADPPETAKARRALESISADGRRASEIIGRIRALVKRQTTRKDRVNVNLKITQVIELAADEIRRSGIVLHSELADGLPRVEGDRVQLQQVLLNLILNAIDAMSSIHDRTRKLTIVSRRDGQDAVLVEVRDTGPGLEPGHAERLFEPFFTTKAEGLGIGLSISRSIVEAHGGRLWVSPNEPHGAIFRFSLPVEQAAP